MRIKSILLLLVCFLLSCLTVPVIACLPDCDDCETWNPETETCESDCSTGQCCEDDDCVSTCPGCKSCDGEYCYDDDENCSTCKECDDGDCVLKSTSECDVASDCTGECHNGCSSCSCVNDDSKCSICKRCDEGNCVLKTTSECDVDSDCDPDQYCYLCDCRCNDCYAWEYVPENYLTPCPACDNDEGGCYSDFFWIQDGHDIFGGGPPSSGEMGLCDNPTKTEVVGYHIFCVDYDTDVDEVIETVISLGIDLSTYVDCGACVATLGEAISSCFKCIMGLIVDEIIEDSPCIWVEGCEHCYDWDETCSTPIEVEVVDWDKVDSDDIDFCYPGIDWP